jgi:hypothetical protein
VHGIWLYGAHWFSFEWYGIVNGLKNLGPFAVIVALGAVVYVFGRAAIKTADLSAQGPGLEAAVLFLAIFLAGLVLTGVQEQYPYVMYGTRSSRIYTAASLGGSGLLAWLFCLVFRTNFREGRKRLLGASLVFCAVACLVANSLHDQREYAAAWSKARNTLVSIFSQLDDIDEGDVVILLSNYRPHIVGTRIDFAIRPWGFWPDLLDEIFVWSRNGKPVEGPRMAWAFGASGDLQNYMRGAKLGASGEIVWPPNLRLRFRPWKGTPVARPGDVIFFAETATGAERINQPIHVDGVRINKAPGDLRSKAPLSREMREPYIYYFYPEAALLKPAEYGRIRYESPDDSGR